MFNHKFVLIGFTLATVAGIAYCEKKGIGDVNYDSIDERIVNDDNICIKMDKFVPCAQNNTLINQKGQFGCIKLCVSNPNLYINSEIDEWVCGECEDSIETTSSYYISEEGMNEEDTPTDDTYENICKATNKYVSCTENTTAISQKGLKGCIKLCVDDPNPYITSTIEEWECGVCDNDKTVSRNNKELKVNYNQGIELGTHKSVTNENICKQKNEYVSCTETTTLINHVGLTGCVKLCVLDPSLYMTSVVEEWSCGDCKNSDQVIQLGAPKPATNENICQQKNEFVSCTGTTSLISHVGLTGCVKLCVFDPNPYVASFLEKWVCGDCKNDDAVVFN